MTDIDFVGGMTHHASIGSSSTIGINENKSGLTYFVEMGDPALSILSRFAH